MTFSTLRVAVLVTSLSWTAPASHARAQAATTSADSAFHLARLFGDGMVLQRGTSIPVWGSAPAGARVDVTLGGAAAHTVAKGGRWKLSLPAMGAGGPYTMTVRSGGRRLTLRDVLIGDVWLASGQSNMELEVSHAANASEEIRAAHDSLIRQFKVPISWGWTRVDDVAGGSWTPADSAHVGRFTAVGYYFARELRRSVPVPIGVINSTWGGSAIETWLSPADNGLTPDAYAALQRAESQRTETVREKWRARLGTLPASDLGTVNGAAIWADPALADSAWDTMPVPSYWEANGYADLDGVAWYRRELDLTPAEIAAAPTLVLGAVDDDDVTWVNGVEVGRTRGYDARRSYRLPASALRVGRNVLAVRVTDGGGGGGINGEPSLVFADGARRSLAGRWRFRVGRVALGDDGQHINKLPAVTFNRMIAPLLDFPIRGVLWYQGESNANNPAQARAYRESFATLIRSWRGAFPPTGGPIPFLWVQLPNYGSPDSVPPAAPGWALQRESMEGALALPNTGQAITIDVGEDRELHPRNKQDVGARLARVALATAYRRPVVASGPRFRSMLLHGDTVAVTFDDVGSGLRTGAPDERSVGSFAIAGADRRFVWANARIVGDHVEVWSDSVRAPVAVRYAWANAPRGPLLYNRDGLPAAPFRSDRW